MFRSLFGLYNVIFFGIRLSSIPYTWYFHCDLNFAILAFRLQIFSSSFFIPYLVLPCVATHSLSLRLYSPLDFDRFFSFLILYKVGRTPGTGDHQPLLKAVTCTQNNTNTNIHASSRIRTHDRSVRAGEDGSYALDGVPAVIGGLFHSSRILFLQFRFLLSVFCCCYSPNFGSMYKRRYRHGVVKGYLSLLLSCYSVFYVLCCTLNETYSFLFWNPCWWRNHHALQEDRADHVGLIYKEDDDDDDDDRKDCILLGDL
jgi:hypothetical protein